MLTEILIIFLGILILGIIVLAISGNLKRSFQVMSGWGIYEAYNFSFDFLLWPLIQAFYGFIGIILLIVIALVNNFVILIWYEKKKADWFGVDVLEDLKTKGHLWVSKIDGNKNSIKRASLYVPAKILQLIIWLLNKNDIFAFVSLSLWQDSFITTIFLRHGNFKKLTSRDYIIFVSSTILSCLWWSVLMQVVITVLKTVWNMS